MATFKERERSGKKWDAEARGPGGGARHAAFKKRAMGLPPKEPTIRASTTSEEGPATPKPSPTNVRANPAMRPRVREGNPPVSPTIAQEVQPEAQDDFLASIPSPGEHPRDLRGAAEEKGKKVPAQANPFARLKATPRPTPGEPTIGGNGTQETPPQEKKVWIPKRIPPVARQEDQDGVLDYSSIDTSSPQVGAQEDEEGDFTIPTRRINPVERKTSLAVLNNEVIEKARKRREEPPEDPRKTREAITLLGLTETACDTCPLQETCGYFEEGALCAYGDAYQGLLASDDAANMALIETLADYQAVRAHRAVLYEARLTGGQLSGDVTRQIEIAAQAAIRLRQLKAPPAEPVGTTTTVTFQHTEPAQPQKAGGILSQLVAGMLGAAANVAATGPKTVESEGIDVPLPARGGQGQEGPIPAQETTMGAEAIPEGGFPGPMGGGPPPPEPSGRGSPEPSGRGSPEPPQEGPSPTPAPVPE